MDNKRLQINKSNPFYWLLFIVPLVGLGMFAIAWLSIGQSAATQLATGSSNAAPAEQAYHRLQETAGSIGGNWLRTLNPSVKAVQGDLVWNSKEQFGVMRLLNLPNPGNGYHYQVLVFDSYAESGQGTPLASLAIGSGRGSLYVPLRTAKKIIEPYKFVLTRSPVGERAEAQILLMVQP